MGCRGSDTVSNKGVAKAATLKMDVPGALLGDAKWPPNRLLSTPVCTTNYRNTDIFPGAVINGRYSHLELRCSHGNFRNLRVESSAFDSRRDGFLWGPEILTASRKALVIWLSDRTLLKRLCRKSEDLAGDLIGDSWHITTNLRFRNAVQRHRAIAYQRYNTVNRWQAAIDAVREGRCAGIEENRHEIRNRHGCVRFTECCAVFN